MDKQPGALIYPTDKFSIFFFLHYHKNMCDCDQNSGTRTTGKNQMCCPFCHLHDHSNRNNESNDLDDQSIVSEFLAQDEWDKCK